MVQTKLANIKNEDASGASSHFDPSVRVDLIKISTFNFSDCHLESPPRVTFLGGDFQWGISAFGSSQHCPTRALLKQGMPGG